MAELLTDLPRMLAALLLGIALAGGWRAAQWMRHARPQVTRDPITPQALRRMPRAMTGQGFVLK